jgi:hypothetical protein
MSSTGMSDITPSSTIVRLLHQQQRQQQHWIRRQRRNSIHVGSFTHLSSPSRRQQQQRNNGYRFLLQDYTAVRSCKTEMTGTKLRWRFGVASSSSSSSSSSLHMQNDNNSNRWNGEVVPNTEDGRIRGCTIQPVVVVGSNNHQLPEDSVITSTTEWVISIDGVAADLGRFSTAIYQKVLREAQQQRFQGFRVGTVPSHLLSTYRTIAMDECARETIVEVMQQNHIRPFENCRAEMMLFNFTIPPSLITKRSTKKNPKKKSNRRNSNSDISDTDVTAGTISTTKNNDEGMEYDDTAAASSQWNMYGTMKEAIDAGWEPGQSFSFSAKNVRGQQADAVQLGTQRFDAATPLGADY